MEPSPFQLAARRLRDNGYSVVPLRPGMKFPILKEWSKYCVEPADEDTFRLWMGWPECNVGLCLGLASGVMALDFDDDVDDLHARIVKLVGDSPVKKAGKRGYTAFYRFGNERSVSERIEGVTVLDVLANGRQTVLPPSLHPEGMRYRWLTDRTLENTPAGDLPAIDPAAMAKVLKLFPGNTAVTKPAYRSEPFDFSDERDVAEALRFIPPDVPYPEWRDIGMAIKDGCGGRGFAIWDEWSSRGEKYRGSAATRKTWDSFRGQGIHLGTLFHHAFSHGYVRPPEESGPTPYAPGGNLERGEPQKKTAAGEIGKIGIIAEVVDPQEIPDAIFYGKIDGKIVDEVFDAPGLPGLIASFINQTAIYKLPVLSLGAALAFSGMVMANKVESPTGLRSNIYALGVAESGSGKDWPRQVCKYLMLRSGLEKREMGEPVSGSGLLTGLVNAGNAGLILIDEFGLFMQAMSGKTAGTHKKEIARYMMELYTSAGQVFLGPEYANKDGTNPRLTIANPCLSMFPTTTPSTFYDSITGKEVVDGFLARFLIFESDRYPIKQQEGRRELEDIPPELWQQIEYWKAQSVNSDPGSNLGEFYTKPLRIPFTDGATKLFRDYGIAMRLKAGRGDSRQSNLSSIYSRINENAIKLALVANENGQVDERVATWAIRTAEFCSGMLTTAVRESIGDNDHERLFKRLLKVIAEMEGEELHPLGVPHSQLLRKTRFMDTRTRNEMLQEAHAAGDIEARQDPDREPGKTGSVPLFYRVRKKDA